MATREEIREGKKAKVTQIKDLAFNMFGKAMEDGVSDRENPQVIVARDHTSVNWMVILKKPDQIDPNASLFRAKMDFTPREAETDLAPQIGTQHYLIVGYAKADLDKKYFQQDAGVTAKMIGYDRPAEILPWIDSQNPTCYVVTPITDAVPEQKKLYVLLAQKAGLCTPYQISKDMVFWRWEYRSDDKSLSKRKVAWPNLMTQHSVRVGTNLPASSKQEVFKRAQNVGKVIVEPHEDLGNEMKMMALAFKETKKPWFLAEMKRLLKRANIDLDYRPLLPNKGLRTFVLLDGVDFGEDDAKCVVEEVASMWPEVEGMTADKVLYLNKLLRQEGFQIKLFQLKGLLAEAMYQLAEVTPDNPLMDETGFVATLAATLDRVVGKEAQPKPTATNMTEEARDALLAAVLTKLKEILEVYHKFHDDLNALFGDHVLEGAGPYDFWSKFKESPDTDSARMCFFHVFKFMAVEEQHVLHEGFIKPLREVVQVLENLDLSAN
ncbi:hypothetical protein PV08_05899 [Exophiala spinifera]|uniref:Uncharacterized protein n=1 Tax=Exophiala spinifera TaxID=91928 RepID=A0A0D2BX17_9EURO|nr:uncharacterized protein PV08_05899 [Exophiala spinifera]KIW15849.1 hypothetical protein PV08_05899 [Exophiala spinifera]